MNTAPRSNDHPPFYHLTRVHLAIAGMLLAVLLFQFAKTHAYQYLIFIFLGILFIVAQVIALRRFQYTGQPAPSTWIVIIALLLSILTLAGFLRKPLPVCSFLLAAIPLFVVASDQWKQLPHVLFLTLIASAATILADLVVPWPQLELAVKAPHLWWYGTIGFTIYILCLTWIFNAHRRQKGRQPRPQINVTTQYALVITAISAMAIILVTGALITHIRNARIDQVGNGFQTIAENFAKLAGSHMEQQTQKLQLLAEQVPIFKEGLVKANARYPQSQKAARAILEQRNRSWEGPGRDSAFIMNYLNNPIIQALSRFRGHNSFHSDLLLVDRYGGLVASLGKMPEHLYFFEQSWWEITWNGGLGDLFIGDFRRDERTMLPRIRIAVGIIDHTTNEVIGALSSNYLLKTLIKDIRRTKPDSVDQISITDAQGNIIASTIKDMEGKRICPQFCEFAMTTKNPDAGWLMDWDHQNRAALIGFATLSTAYSVISDPLQRLGWHVVVSGTRARALSGVRQSTELAMLVGLVAMALGLLVAVAAARVITRPIENLTATASAMSEGHLESRAQVDGPEELVALAEGFNRLTDRLHAVIRNLKTQTEQLIRAKGEAENATRIKGEFLANISHEIRTPLNAIIGFADILETFIADTKQKRHARTIKDSGSDLLHLINDLLDLSKIEAGRMELQANAVNLRSMFQELKRIFSISAEEKSILMKMEVAPEVPSHLMLDRVRLRQVLFNLIGNAIKFTDRGRVHCRAVAQAANDKQHWNLQMEIRDTGIGIHSKMQGEIFEPFKQQDADHPGAMQGTGLGLTISKNLVEMMGGRIDVESEPGKGTLFTIHIPRIMAMDVRVNEPDAPPGGLNYSEYILFKSASILIADDLETNRLLLTETLKSFPVDITQATGGRQAVSLASQKQFDLILLDIRMPDMNGYETLKRIRQVHPPEHLPIIAITAAGMKEDIARIQQAGFDDYLIRPFGQEELVRLLAQFLPHELADSNSPPQKPLLILEAFDAELETGWTCPSEAMDIVTKRLEPHWKQVLRKQSIPDIVDFAREVRSVGDHYQVRLLRRYGAELGEYAEAFDIHHVEKLLDYFNEILKSRGADNR